MLTLYEQTMLTSIDIYVFKFRFRIALRQISGNDEDITESLNNFEANGFINYYGHQRFGNHASVPTYQIGLFLVQGKFKEVKCKKFQFSVWQLI